MIMKNHHESIETNHNPKRPDHPYRILTIDGSGS